MVNFMLSIFYCKIKEGNKRRKEGSKEWREGGCILTLPTQETKLAFPIVSCNMGRTE